MSKEFPIDVLSAKALGIDSWLKENSTWPIHNRTSIGLKEDILEMYAKLVTDAPDDVRGALLVLFKITTHYEQLLYGRLLIQKTEESGCQIKMDTKNWLYQKLISKDPKDIRLAANQVFNRLVLKTPPFKTKVIGWLKARVYTARNNSIFKTNRNSFLTLGGYPSAELSEFASNNGVRYKYPFPVLFNPSKAQVAPEITKTTEQLRAGLKGIAQKHSCPITDTEIDIYVELTRKLIESTTISLDGFKRTLKKFKSTTILANNLGQALSRTIAVAGKRTGHQIVGAVHGHNVGTYVSPTLAWIDMSIVDTLLVPSKGSVKAFEALKNKTSYIQDQEISITSLNTKFYQDLYLQNPPQATSSSIKSVMLVEFPLTEFRYHNVLSFWPYQLDMMIRVGEFFKSTKIRSLMKVHPDRLKESSALYNSFFDEIISDRFETVLDQADAFIFTDLGTTTFGYAITTRKPIFIFETLFQFVSEELHDSLRKRCHVIPSFISEESKLIFDEKAFSEALVATQEHPDTEFLEKYM